MVIPKDPSVNPLHEASIILFELITGSTLHPVTILPGDNSAG